MQEHTDIIVRKEKACATVKNAAINAAIKSLYSFDSEEQALARLEKIKNQFVISKQAKTSPNSQAVILWIANYSISKEERELGYKGNYAILSVAKKEDKFTINASKIESDISTHPQLKREKQRHPDWLHPILRGIKKKHLYFSLDEASQALAALHEQYPDISLPSEYQLWLMVYGKVDGEKSPVNKYRFMVRPLPDGTFMIDYKLGKKPETKVAEPEGYFTNLVKVKRAMKASRTKYLEDRKKTSPRSDSSS